MTQAAAAQEYDCRQKHQGSSNDVHAGIKLQAPFRMLPIESHDVEASDEMEETMGGVPIAGSRVRKPSRPIQLFRFGDT